MGFGGRDGMIGFRLHWLDYTVFNEDSDSCSCNVVATITTLHLWWWLFPGNRGL